MPPRQAWGGERSRWLRGWCTWWRWPVHARPGHEPVFRPWLLLGETSPFPYLFVFRFGTFLYAAAWPSLLLGFAALTVFLVRSGDELMGVLDGAATVVAAGLGILEATFAVGVTTWAVEEAARSGRTPQIYTVLDEGCSTRYRSSTPRPGSSGWIRRCPVQYPATPLLGRLGFTGMGIGLAPAARDGDPGPPLHALGVIGVALLLSGHPSPRPSNRGTDKEASDD